MFLTRCPNCGELTAVAPAYLRRVVVCPRCPSKYTAEVNEADNTREAFVTHARWLLRDYEHALTSTGAVGVACALIPMALLGVQTATAYEDVGGAHGPLLLTFAVFACSLLLSSLVTYGGTQLVRVKNYPLCVLAAVLAMLPFSNLCFPFGWVTGPIALYWLRKPEVRRAFELNRGEE